MKDRTREAVMSLLGGTFGNAIAFDLFGGTGVLAFETVSRGAAKGVVFEILKSAAREIQIGVEHGKGAAFLRELDRRFVGAITHERGNLRSHGPRLRRVVLQPQHGQGIAESREAQADPAL